MAKVEVIHFALIILCFLSLYLLVSSPAALAAPSKKDGHDHGFEKVLGKNVGLVRRVCNETGHYNLCVAAVEADSRFNLKSHRKGILRIVIDKTISNATAVKAYIDHLLLAADNSTTKMENTTRNSLKACSTNYDDSIYDLYHALSFLELKNLTQFYELRFMLNDMFGTPFDGIYFNDQSPLLTH